MQFSHPLLCLITDRHRCDGRRIEEVVEAAVEGGVGMVQLREKDLPAAELYTLALRLKGAVRGRALFFVNDRIDVALAADADGVQLGENALPLDLARGLVGSSMLLGRSVHSVSGAITAESQGADLLVLGTIFPTGSHPGALTGGLDLVREVAAAVNLPFLGIGGIDESNAKDVVAGGAAGAAVISAIGMATNPASASASLLEEMKSAAVTSSSRET